MKISELIKNRLDDLQVSPKLKNNLEKTNGRPLEYTEPIGDFILTYISLGYTVENICTKFNKITGEEFLTRMKINSWLGNKKLKKFKAQFLRGKEIASFNLLDEMVDKEKDIENLTLDSKAGRVILESMRWRAKVQNPDYFNPANKTELTADHTFKVYTQMPDPDLINEEDIMDAEINPD